MRSINYHSQLHGHFHYGTRQIPHFMNNMDMSNVMNIVQFYIHILENREEHEGKALSFIYEYIWIYSVTTGLELFLI